LKTVSFTKNKLCGEHFKYTTVITTYPHPYSLLSYAKQINSIYRKLVFRKNDNHFLRFFCYFEKYWKIFNFRPTLPLSTDCDHFATRTHSLVENLNITFTAPKGNDSKNLTHIIVRPIYIAKILNKYRYIL